MFLTIAEECDDTELKTELEGISVYDTYKLLLVATEQGNSYICENCSCDEGTFENCGHKCLRECMKLDAYEFNPDDCEKCPINYLPCDYW